MKRSLAKLFQESQYKLNEAPTPSAWRKLERRLDGQRKRKLTIFRQSIAITAVLLLLAVFSVLALQLKQNTALGQVEELKSEESDTQSLRVVAFTRQFRDRLAITIEEGDATKRLTLATPVTKNQMKASLADFKWLEGDWKSTANGQQSTEVWKRKNARLLEGTGVVMSSKGKTVFSEQMRIYASGSTVYFETALESGQAPLRYALKQRSADRIVFENRKIDFPQQIVIELHSPNVYSFILQNEAPLDVSEPQQNHLRQRNKIVPQHIIRVMERAEYQ